MHPQTILLEYCHTTAPYQEPQYDTDSTKVWVSSDDFDELATVKTVKEECAEM